MPAAKAGSYYIVYRERQEDLAAGTVLSSFDALPVGQVRAWLSSGHFGLLSHRRKNLSWR